MLNVTIAAAEPFQSVTRATCGNMVVFVIVNVVVVRGEGARSTSKYGRSSVAAGITAMSQVSSLAVLFGLPVVKRLPCDGAGWIGSWPPAALLTFVSGVQPLPRAAASKAVARSVVVTTTQFCVARGLPADWMRSRFM